MREKRASSYWQRTLRWTWRSLSVWWLMTCARHSYVPLSLSCTSFTFKLLPPSTISYFTPSDTATHQLCSFHTRQQVTRRFTFNCLNSLGSALTAILHSELRRQYIHLYSPNWQQKWTSTVYLKNNNKNLTTKIVLQIATKFAIIVHCRIIS